MFSKLLLITLLTISPATTGKTSFMSIPKPLSYKERVGIKPFTSTLDENQVKCLTDNIYFEARNENDNGKKAVALVTLNRAKSLKYPDTICDVVYHRTSKKQCQFSWTCTKKREIKYPDLYNRCRKIASHTLMNYGYIPDITKGATYFRKHNTRPRWEKKIKVTFTTRNHVFYKI